MAWYWWLIIGFAVLGALRLAGLVYMIYKAMKWH